MSITTLSSREFNQDLGKAKRAANTGPVFITDRGKPAYVLLAIDAYEKVANPRSNIVERLSMPEGEGVNFEAPRLDKTLFKPADLS